MGFFGSVVLCRAGGDLSDVAAIVSRDEGVEEVARLGGDWRIGQSEDAALFEDAEGFLRDLVIETAAPGLLGFVIDSDCVELVAAAPASGMWRSCLDCDSLELYNDGGPLDASVLLPGPATAHALAWAREAGLQPNESSLLEVFSRSGDDQPAESLFTQLVEALGIPDSTAMASSSPVRSANEPTSRARASGSRNPLDAFIADHVTDVLTNSGYTRKGRRFQRVNGRGDVALIQFRSYSLGNLVDFLLDTALIAKPFVDFMQDYVGYQSLGPDLAQGIWSAQWPAPDLPGMPRRSNAWSARDSAQREQLGDAFARTLTKQVLPSLNALSDRPTLLEAIRGRRAEPGHLNAGRAGALMVLLADDGPSDELDQLLTGADDSPYAQAAKARAQAVLAARTP